MGSDETRLHGYTAGLSVLAVACVEEDNNVRKQLAKQTYPILDTVIMVDEEPAQGIDNRRKRIAHNQNYLNLRLEEYIGQNGKPDLIWQVEGDVELDRDTLTRLIDSYVKLKEDAIISGIQVGRHGLYHIGAWFIVDDEHFESINHRLKGVQSVDAMGLYCLLAPTDIWLSGQASWQDEAYGPDVNWCLSIDCNKYVDMDIEIGHHHKNAILYPHHPSTCTVKFEKKGDSWQYKTYLN